MGIAEVKPVCPGCGFDKHVRIRSSDHKRIYYFCAYCKAQWRVLKNPRVVTPEEIARKTCPKCGEVQRTYDRARRGRGAWSTRCEKCNVRWVDYSTKPRRIEAPKPVFSPEARERLKEFLK